MSREIDTLPKYLCHYILALSHNPPIDIQQLTGTPPQNQAQKCQTWASKKEYEKRERERFALRWEFIRRNQQYVKDFKRYSADCKKVNRKDAVAVSDWLKTWEMHFMGRYGIARPLDPSISPAELGLADIRVLYRGVYCLTQERRVSGIDTRGNLETKPLTPKEIEEVVAIEVLIDLDAPMERITREVREVVAGWKRMKDRYAPKPKKRARVDKYSQYLTVFDMKEKGETWEKIAKRFYKGDIARGQCSYAKTKAKKDYERCKRLIGGDYREIR